MTNIALLFPLSLLPLPPSPLPRTMVVDPAIYFFPSLEDVVWTSLETKLSVIALAFLAFLALFVLCYVGSYLFVPSFRTKLRSKDKIFWGLSLVRAIFGICSTAVGLWYLFVDDILLKDTVNAHNVTTFMTAFITTGFFLFECVSLIVFNIYFRFFDKFLFAHHFLIFIGFCISISFNGKGHFYGIVGLLLESTTPFSCICWMLLKCDMAHLTIWKLNQLLLVHFFHCRTTLEAFLFYMTYIHWENVKENLPVPIIVMMLLSLTLNFFVLTPYWTYKKMSQLFKPVDWNHPELSQTQVVANGTTHIGLTQTKKHNGLTRTKKRKTKRE